MRERALFSLLIADADDALPLIGGPEAARRIKADRAETKVVLLTPGDDKPDLGGTENAGDATRRRPEKRRISGPPPWRASRAAGTSQWRGDHS